MCVCEFARTAGYGPDCIRALNIHLYARLHVYIYVCLCECVVVCVRAYIGTYQVEVWGLSQQLNVGSTTVNTSLEIDLVPSETERKRERDYKTLRPPT